MLQYENPTNDAGQPSGSGPDNGQRPTAPAGHGSDSRQAPWERTYQSDAPAAPAPAGQASAASVPETDIAAVDDVTVVHPVIVPGQVPAEEQPGAVGNGHHAAADGSDTFSGADSPTEMIDTTALSAALAADSAPPAGQSGAGPGFGEAPTVMLPVAARPSSAPAGNLVGEQGKYEQSQYEQGQYEQGQYEQGQYEQGQYGQDGPADGNSELPAAADRDFTEPPSDSADSDKRRPGWFLPAIIAGALIVLLGGAYLVDWFVTKDDVAKGTSIGGVDVGGLTPEDAVAKLATEMGARYQTPVTLKAHGQDVELDPAAAGLAADLRASVDAAGTRSASPISRIQELFGSTTELPIVVNTDTAALTAWVTQVAATTDQAAVEGSVTLEGTAVNVVEPVVGQHLDVAASASLIQDTWATGNPAALTGVELPVTQEPVRASQAGIDLATTELSTILAGPLTVNAGATPLSIPVETLAAALVVAPDAGDGFSVTIDEAAIKANYQAAVEATQTTPSDASIAIVDNAPLITPGVDGMVVDWASTDAALAAALRSPEHVLTVAYAVTPPAVTTASIEALGIKEVIGEFTTGGFAYTSGQNVKQAAAEIGGALVAAGETFSLNEYTGPRGVDEGYIEAGIIENGVAAKAVGGGISQLATTLYNASYFAGMEDVEHKAHSYYISRYPEGREATVFQNPDGSSVIDVAFKNDYGTAIIIQTIWTEEDITVKIWGTKTVEVTSATSDRYNYTSAPTKTIPFGESCSPSNGTSGFSVDNTRTITDLAGTVISAETSTTVYNGQVAITCEPAPVAPTPPPVEQTPGETPGETPGG